MVLRVGAMLGPQHWPYLMTSGMTVFFFSLSFSLSWLFIVSPFLSHTHFLPVSILSLPSSLLFPLSVSLLPSLWLSRVLSSSLSSSLSLPRSVYCYAFLSISFSLCLPSSAVSWLTYLEVCVNVMSWLVVLSTTTELGMKYWLTCTSAVGGSE